MSGGFDHVTAGEAYARPGMDTRQWLSFGTVSLDTSEAPSVIFKDEKGKDLVSGPLVSVKLHPSGTTVGCRVGHQVAGNQEGEWYPFVQGDEVLVAIPEGDEAGGCVILCRLNQEIDTWPVTVGGQDATTNTFGFRRMRTPYIIETANAWMVRSAITGSQLTLDATGNWVMSNGDGHGVVIRPDFVSFALSDNSTFLQLDPATKQAFLQAGDTTSFLLDADESTFITAGTLTWITSGAGGTQHAVTLEQLVSILANFIPALVVAGIFTPLTPPTLTLVDACLTATLVGAANPVPYGATPSPVSPGGIVLPGLPLTFGPVTGAVSLGLAAAANPVAAVLDLAGTFPGVGRPGFML